MVKKKPNDMAERRKAAAQDIRNRLRGVRAMRGLTQRELGERLGVSHHQVYRYERGTAEITAAQLYQVAVILNVPIAAFFPETNAVR